MKFYSCNIIKKVLVIIPLFLCTFVCFAQKYDGDWKGKIVYGSGYEEEFIFHIVGDECSEELVRRSSSDVKEAMIEMKVEGETIVLMTRKKGVFTGKLIKGKIVGSYEDRGGDSFSMTLSKFGKGAINVQKNYNKKNGMVVY